MAIVSEVERKLKPPDRHGESASRRMIGWAAWPGLFFALLQSVCTFFAALDGLRLLIGVTSLAVSAGGRADAGCHSFGLDSRTYGCVCRGWIFSEPGSCLAGAAVAGAAVCSLAAEGGQFKSAAQRVDTGDVIDCDTDPRGDRGTSAFPLGAALLSRRQSGLFRSARLE